VGANLAFFQSLSPENQKIVIDAARETAPYQRKLSDDEDDTMKKDLVAKGMELTVLNRNSWGFSRRPWSRSIRNSRLKLEKSCSRNL